MQKQCNKCKNWLEVNAGNFHRDKYRLDGFTMTCKACRLLSKKIYDDNNRGTIRNKALQRYYVNLEDNQQKALEYYHNNKESCLERNRIWIENHPEERRQHKIRSSAKRKAILLNCYAEHITQEEILELIAFYPNCPYCGVFLTRENTQFDHVYPLSKGGLHTIFNLMPCCKPCNNKKHNKLPINWFRAVALI